MTQPNANAAHADDGAIATALDGVIARGEQNLLAESAAPGIEGARAALETFYFAFNTRSLDLVQRMWADDPNVELATPLVGVVRGSANIAAFYTRGFAGPARIQSAFEDIVAYATPELVVFAGRERGTYARWRAWRDISRTPRNPHHLHLHLSLHCRAGRLAAGAASRGIRRRGAARPISARGARRVGRRVQRLS